MNALIVDSLVGNDYSLCLCNGLKQEGVDVGFVCVKNRKAPFTVHFPMLGWSPAKGDGKGIWGKSVGYLSYLFRLLRHVRRASPADRVVHFQFFRRERIEAFFLLVLKLAGARIVYTAHNILPHERSNLDVFIKRVVYSTVDRIIVHSSFIKNELIRQFPATEQKIRVVPHGNFNHYVPSSPPPRALARETLGLPTDKPVLLFFGYIREYKGLDLLLEAMQLIQKRGSDAHLVIAGLPHSAMLRERYEAAIEGLPSPEQVTFHDRFIPHEDVPHYFVASDLVVLPYRNIYHSGIVHLAYSFGRPVLTTNTGDFSETVEQGKSGMVLHHNSPEALADAIIELISHRTQLQSMGEYARNLSNSRYSWSDIGRQTKLVYEELV